MTELQRNTLVWLTPQGWTAVHAQDWEAPVQDLLRYWQTCQFPWVVAHQRPGVTAGEVCLGLPAPQHWGRRRLGAQVALDGIARQGQFPLLDEVARSHLWGIPAASWLTRGAGLGMDVRVYGSYGWQHMTGMPYVRAGSDLDLSVYVSDLTGAMRALEWLAQAGETSDTGRAASQRLPLRVDGEIVFPRGPAVAWRELQAMRQGQVRQVLVKDRRQLRLLEWADLVALVDARPASLV